MNKELALVQYALIRAGINMELWMIEMVISLNELAKEGSDEISIRNIDETISGVRDRHEPSDDPSKG